ncbi:MAG: proton extrusion protein PcxA [Hydrococcus sp. SU_1_0]|nr:proton extrusion protein PcxA [Hydrococcus sp. SU_1_0]NJP21585.1 proton extrusion protein PcxA [Hydrococcus sp. CRU_1_1]
MTSTFPNKPVSPFTQFKDQIFGNPEQSLEQAYQAATNIKAIEDRYYDGERIPVELLDNPAYIPAALKADFEKNLDILKRKRKEFNSSSSAQGRLGPNHLDKLIFVEGITAKYTIEESSDSALIPTQGTAIRHDRIERQSYPSPINIIEVSSLATPTPTPKKSDRPRQEKANAQTDEDSFVKNKKGVLPRSIGKTFNKIKEELDPKSEEEVVSKFRRSRTQTIISLRLLALLIVIPLITQQVSKNFLVLPIVNQVRPNYETQVFLNSEMKEEALTELKTFEEELKLEALITKAPALSSEAIEVKVKEKADELAKEYHHKSNSAISNVFADMIAFLAFGIVLLFRKADIAVIKSFIDKIIYGLSDSAKAFIIILVTDIFVGFHSPHGWEVILEGMANHLGVAANHSAISLFIATVPVIMDTMLKYWLFRYLSQMSPSTLATMKGMNE